MVLPGCHGEVDVGGCGKREEFNNSWTSGRAASNWHHLFPVMKWKEPEKKKKDYGFRRAVFGIREISRDDVK